MNKMIQAVLFASIALSPLAHAHPPDTSYRIGRSEVHNAAGDLFLGQWWVSEAPSESGRINGVRYQYDYTAEPGASWNATGEIARVCIDDTIPSERCGANTFGCIDDQVTLFGRELPTFVADGTYLSKLTVTQKNSTFHMDSEFIRVEGDKREMFADHSVAQYYQPEFIRRVRGYLYAHATAEELAARRLCR